MAGATLTDPRTALGGSAPAACPPRRRNARGLALAGSALVLGAVLSSYGCADQRQSAPAATDSNGQAQQRRAAGSGSALGAAPATPDAAAPGPDAVETTIGELSLVLRPEIQPRPGVSVLMELRGAVLGRLGAFAMAPSWAGVRGPRNVHDFVLSDSHGPVHVDADEDRGEWTLGRAPAGDRLVVSYFASADEQQNRYDLHVDAAGMQGVGHSFLVMPAVDEPLQVHLRWDLGEMGSAQGGASFGVGEDVVTVRRPPELAHSMYVAGRLVVREGGFGERFIALGEPAFDPAEAIRFCSASLAVARRQFDPADRQPFAFMFVPRPHLGADHDGAYLYQSFALWFDQNRTLDARLRVLIAHEIVHRWIGSALRFVGPDGSDAAWFSEGFATHYARSLLHRRGLIRHEEMLAEINRSVEADEQAFETASRQPLRPGGPTPTPSPSTPASPPEPRGPMGTAVDAPNRCPALVHHGALYAALVEAELERRGGERLDALLGRLMQRARASDGALPEAAWREAVTSALGPEAGKEFDLLIVQNGAAVDLPSGTFGRCFVRLVTKHASYELGFDAASLRADPPLVRGLVPGSAAERAGLREGDLLLSGQKNVTVGDSSHNITLLAAGEQGTHLVRFSPQAITERAHWELSPKCRR
jgi:hypothetical protein